MQLVFATNNKNKLKEIRNILEPEFKILSLSDINCSDELPETSSTLEGNASQKAWFVYNKILSFLHPKNGELKVLPIGDDLPAGKAGLGGAKLNCFADDTGLEIDALNGRPGVFSARYAGEQCNAEDNIKKVLSEMKGISDRKAKFRTAISLIIDGKEKQFEGKVDGIILTEKKGSAGFGYDPVFAPFSNGEVTGSPSEASAKEGVRLSFAQMSFSEKNRISHRAIAVKKLAEYLLSLKK